MDERTPEAGTVSLGTFKQLMAAVAKASDVALTEYVISGFSDQEMYAEWLEHFELLPMSEMIRSMQEVTLEIIYCEIVYHAHGAPALLSTGIREEWQAFPLGLTLVEFAFQHIDWEAVVHALFDERYADEEQTL